jgi:hypothetical protein
VAVTASACGGKLTAGLSKQEVVVVFNPQATQAEHAAVRRDCSGIPGTSAEPLPGPGAPLASQVYDVRFRVDHASNAELNRLLVCLTHHQKQGVLSYDMPDNSDN